MIPTGQHIAAIRKSKGMTQEELANKASVTVRTIQRIESGENTPRDYTIKALAAALDVAPEVFFPPAPAVNHGGSKHTEEDIEEASHFLQMLNLSCYSFLVLPCIHFLVPLFILKNHKPASPLVTRTGRRIIQYQICWSVATSLLLLLLVIYNFIMVKKLNLPQFTISYLWTAIAMSLVHAVVIFIAFLWLRKAQFEVYTLQFFRHLLRMKT